MNFLDIYFKIINNKLNIDIYYKPTDSHNYLHYESCHPQHTRDNIALSLAKRIVRIVSDNREQALADLQKHLIRQDHPTEKICHAFSRTFQPKSSVPLETLVFSSTYNTIMIIECSKTCLRMFEHRGCGKPLAAVKLSLAPVNPTPCGNSW